MNVWPHLFRGTVVVLLLVVVSFPLSAQVPERSATTTFFESSPEVQLVQPKRVDVWNHRVMVRDQGLDEYIHLSDTGSSNLLGDTRSTDWLIDRWREARVSGEWLGEREYRGFWDSEGTYWRYSPESTSETDTLVVRSVEEERTTVTLPGNVRRIVPHEAFWYLQRDTAPLLKWDPGSSDGLVDTGPGGVRGQLFGIGENGTFYTRSRGEIRRYDGSTVDETRVVQDLQAVDRSGSSLYVLTGDNRVLKLDSSLSVQFTFHVDRDFDPVDLDVEGTQLYIVGADGLHTARLDTTQRAFFSASQDLSFSTMLSTLPAFDERSPVERLWANLGTNYDTLYLQQNGEDIRVLQGHDTNLQRTGNQLTTDNLPLDAFQYFQSKSTFWNGTDRLYYFFPEEQSVEAYDSEGRTVRRAVLSFEEPDHARNVTFIGADADRILFRGEIPHPDHGFRQTLLVYSWDGDLRRVVRPREFPGSNYAEAVTPSSNWTYDGEGLVFTLEADRIRAFDLQGYPAWTLSDVDDPLVIQRAGDRLYVLDLNGWRVSSYDVKAGPEYRLATPPENLAVKDAENVGNGPVILSGRRGGDGGRYSIYEYSPGDFKFQSVFEHPNRSLRYPTVASDTLFFWGRRSGESRHQLYVSDLQQYAARALDVRFEAGEGGVYDEDRGILLVPRGTPQSDTAPGIWYTDATESMKPLENSGGLKQIVPGGFTGYYGVRKTNDRYAVVTGYLHRDHDTAPWSWTTSDTIWATPFPIEQLGLRNGRLLLSQSTDYGVSELLAMETTDVDQNSVESVFQSDGSLRWVQRDSGRILALHRTSRRRGNLALLYSQSAPTGGAQGQLVSNEPASMSDIALRSQPGGQRFETESGGRFSVDGLPAGYVRIVTESYKKHFSFPVRIPILPDEYNLLSDISMDVESELLLLERGLRYFNDGEFSQGRIALEAYRDLVENGPYYRLAGSFLKEIYLRQGDVEPLVGLLREEPSLFTPRDLFTLYERTRSDRTRRSILKQFDPPWNPYLESVWHEQVNVTDERSAPARFRDLSGRSRSKNVTADNDIVPDTEPILSPDTPTASDTETEDL